LEFLEDPCTSGANVQLVKLGSCRNILDLPARKIVHDGDFVATCQQLLGYMRPDKPGTAGEQYAHLR